MAYEEVKFDKGNKAHVDYLTQVGKDWHTPGAPVHMGAPGGIMGFPEGAPKGLSAKVAPAKKAAAKKSAPAKGAAAPVKKAAKKKMI
ncbi:hypothetical protein UFOVP965_115 [uncultured Caudovirales phage]|uniref:Uncharacterized protein n=1 Tax=uncultured Caudovirales phage TaxID=2100421 RepID=A0A6J5QJV7_9CAUD|nr:hypothetical protein UFOVP965_115 [uncultured Caudovirales phage]CAB4179904.1 hypothetical protein UFOVP1035_111 [uncultured Caudovirales phage]CAB4188730.1 hypothetical protein UFOVP1181_70 [uncultured Caudovirales phage]